MSKEIKLNSKDVDVKDKKILIKNQDIISKIESENDLRLEDKEGQNWQICVDVR